MMPVMADRMAFEQDADLVPRALLSRGEVAQLPLRPARSQGADEMRDAQVVGRDGGRWNRRLCVHGREECLRRWCDARRIAAPGSSPALQQLPRRSKPGSDADRS